MKTTLVCICCALMVGWAAAGGSDQVFGKLPIREVTVFKDGHAFVAHEGSMPTDAEGGVTMDYLPTPVIGTFWPYAVEKGATLASVVAGRRRVEVERTALNLRELLEGNIGAEAIVTEAGTNSYEATILDLPRRDSLELAGASAPGAEERLPERGGIILLKTRAGTRALPVERIQEITFKDRHRSKFVNDEFRNVLTLNLDWKSRKPAKTAKVGLFYLQKGLRWIPSYKVDIDGSGKALLKLQGTLVNELADLEGAAVNLVVGVPTIAFKDTLDPMALQQTLAHLSQHFQSGSTVRNSPIASHFSNAIMSQTIVPAQMAAGAVGGGGSLEGPAASAERNEDLFVFSLPSVTLKKGERMVVTLAEIPAAYRDVFTLDLPIRPPAEFQRQLGWEQQREMARLLDSPKVMHKIRLSNDSRFPFTTAPALILRQGKAMAQGLMTYTAPGGKVDLPVTAAVEFQVLLEEKEIKRTPDAMRANNTLYSRVDLGGTVKIVSHKSTVEEIEVTRETFGIADGADAGGRFEQLNLFDQRFEQPWWWGWYSWPYWAYHHNGLGRFTWTLKLEPKQTGKVTYQWHYFWN